MTLQNKSELKLKEEEEEKKERCCLTSFKFPI
jgi:hypothetical protein